VFSSALPVIADLAVSNLSWKQNTTCPGMSSPVGCTHCTAAQQTQASCHNHTWSYGQPALLNPCHCTHAAAAAVAVRLWSPKRVPKTATACRQPYCQGYFCMYCKVYCEEYCQPPSPAALLRRLRRLNAARALLRCALLWCGALRHPQQSQLQQQQHLVRAARPQGSWCVCAATT
jgi:hypothetical protein